MQFLLNQLFTQILCVSCFAELISGSFRNGPVNNSRHYVLDTVFGIIMGSFCNKPVNKIRHYLLANSITWLGLHLLWDK